MSTIQKLVKAVLPKSWVESLRTASEAWLLRCETCGASRSVWEAGGIRAGAASRGKRVRVHCPGCGHVTWSTLEHRNPAGS